MKSIVVGCYDIRDPKRLRKIAELMEGWGVRVQFSVFRCFLDEKEREQLRWKISSLMDSVDSILFLPVCKACTQRVSTLGAQPPWEDKIPRITIL